MQTCHVRLCHRQSPTIFLPARARFLQPSTLLEDSPRIHSCESCNFILDAVYPHLRLLSSLSLFFCSFFGLLPSSELRCDGSSNLAEGLKAIAHSCTRRGVKQTQSFEEITECRRGCRKGRSRACRGTQRYRSRMQL
jgi:hypothetical protein